MNVYNYQIDFPSIKKWLPETTNKVINCLETLVKNNVTEPTVKPKKFKIKDTKWQLCAKPKNTKSKDFIDKYIHDNPVLSLDNFKKFLELSSIAEIYIKAVFDTITYRTACITYRSYKHQHIDISSKNKSIKNKIMNYIDNVYNDNKLLDDNVNKQSNSINFINTSINDSIKNVKVDIKNKNISYFSIKDNSSKYIYNARFFTFDDTPNKTFIIGCHTDTEVEQQCFTLYEVIDNLIVPKYYMGIDIVNLINSIKDLSYHDINGKKIKILINSQNINYSM